MVLAKHGRWGVRCWKKSIECGLWVKRKEQRPEQGRASGANCSQAEKGLKQSGKNPVVPLSFTGNGDSMLLFPLPPFLYYQLAWSPCEQWQELGSCWHAQMCSVNQCCGPVQAEESENLSHSLGRWPRDTGPCHTVGLRWSKRTQDGETRPPRW